MNLGDQAAEVYKLLSRGTAAKHLVGPLCELASSAHAPYSWRDTTTHAGSGYDRDKGEMPISQKACQSSPNVVRVPPARHTPILCRDCKMTKIKPGVAVVVLQFCAS